ncbi:MAG: sulfotransferase [Methylorubrum populi]
MRIVAIISARNEQLMLPRTLDHLHRQGIDVCIIDNESTDRTRAIAERFRDRGVFRIETLPYRGYFELTQQLQMKQRLAEEIEADWFIHQDADEILQAPEGFPDLRSAIATADAAGANAINFDEFVFAPCAGENFEDDDHVAKMRRYYFFEPVPNRLVRAWKKKALARQLTATGGHQEYGEHLKLFPENFILRHYIALSLGHLKSQYLGRVFCGRELEKGWHHNRVATTLDFARLPEPDQLHDLDRDGWRKDRKRIEHLVFDQPGPYVPPRRLPADESRAPMPFVVGVARSGTTLLRLLLDAHPDLAMTPETNWLGGALAALRPDAPADAFRKALTGAPNWGDMEIGEAALDAILAQPFAAPGDRLRAIYRAYAARFGVSRIGDKTPLHGSRMTTIREALPEARFIHIVRDGRDVALSLRELWFGPGRDAEDAAAFWMWHLRQIRQEAQFVPHYLEVRFEELVADPRKVLTEIGAFIDLPFHEDQLRAHERAAARLTELKDVHWGTRRITAEQRKGLFTLTSKPPLPERAEVWRREMSAEDQEAFRRVAGGMLRQLSYPV